MISINLMKGDCLERMKEIPDKSVDMVLTDPPYGTTACKWDSVIDFKLMWSELKRIVRSEKSTIVLFGSEPFSSALRMSNIKEFKYDWIWKKPQGTGVLNSKRQPLRDSEIISVFYKVQSTYNPQFSNGKPYKFTHNTQEKRDKKYGEFETIIRQSDGKRYPKTILEFDNKSKLNQGLHPTQKPVALLEYLIKTYTLENETVLDFTMGSGSTGVACKNLNRNFIGIERDEKYFEIASKRIEEA